MQEVIGTDIEMVVYNWLVKHKIVFTFQSSLRGGYFALGGAVVDFLLEPRRIALRCFGEYWHRGVVKSGQDILQKEMLGELGYTVVDLWSDDIENRLEETLQLALLGQEMLR